MRQAMNLVREEHGDDAVILSTKDTDGGVELVAALDSEAIQPQQEDTMSSMGATYHSPEIRNSMPHQQSFNGSADISTMARELKTVRAML
jgi:flagellar biosynthesis protein FlhF